MSKPLVRIHDLLNDEVIDREMTAAEFKVYEAEQKVQQKLKSEIEAKEASRQAILARLGLTVDELKTILG